MIDFEKIGNIAVITINRPDARNAVNTAVAQGIEDAIDQVESDDEIWAAILTGAKTEKGYIFCAGADLKEQLTRSGQHAAESNCLRLIFIFASALVPKRGLVIGAFITDNGGSIFAHCANLIIKLMI